MSEGRAIIWKRDADLLKIYKPSKGGKYILRKYKRPDGRTYLERFLNLLRKQGCYFEVEDFGSHWKVRYSA